MVDKAKKTKEQHCAKTVTLTILKITKRILNFYRQKFVANETCKTQYFFNLMIDSHLAKVTSIFNSLQQFMYGGRGWG